MNKGGNNLVVFLGTTPNIGTTVVAFGTASMLAEKTEQSVAYLCLNLKSSKIHRYLGIDQPAVTLDEIRPQIKSRTLTADRLRSCCHKVKTSADLYVMFGNTLRDQAEFYTPEDVEYLLHTASSAFDLCIVEVNAYWDNAATVCAVLQADTKILVTTNHLGHFQEDLNRWLHSMTALFDLDPQSFALFVTQKVSSLRYGGYQLKEIRRETGLQIVGGMRRFDEVDAVLSEGRILDLFAERQPLSEDLVPFTEMLIHLYQLPRPAAKNKRTWLKKPGLLFMPHK
jgi:hypothetical protein